MTETESAAFIRQPSEVVIFTLLAIQARLGDAKPAAGPNTPSGAVPPYEKPAAKQKQGKQRRGGQQGHPGSRRPLPVTPDRTREQRLTRCPDCGTKLRPTGETRERFSEDIP
ncbi:MAG: IS66 family transposase, partial [Planctomycetaceae bacterium]